MESTNSKTPYFDVGERLRFYREHYTNLAQGAFAEGAGLVRTTYVSWETGGSRVSLNGALALRETYGLPLDFLYCGNSDMLSKEARTAWLGNP